MTDPLLISRREAASRLGIGLSTFDQRVRPHLRLVRTGRKVLVPVDELERFVRERAS